MNFLARKIIRYSRVLIVSGTQYNGVFTRSRTGIEPRTGTRTRIMGENRSRGMSWLRCSVKVFTHFHTTHLFPVSVNTSQIRGFMVYSHLRFITRKLLPDLKLQKNKKWVQNPLLGCSVHTIVHAVAGVNAPT